MQAARLAAVLICASCAIPSPPASYSGTSPQPAADLHQCATREVVSRGYTIQETSRADGLLRATRPLGSYSFQRVLQVLVYDAGDSGGQVLRAQALRSAQDGSLDTLAESMHLPTIEDARAIVAACSTPDTVTP